MLRPRTRPPEPENARTPETPAKPTTQNGVFSTTFGVEVITPLIKQNTYDSRFSTLGGYFPVSFPLGIALMPNSQIFGEFGPAVTLSSIRISPTATPFTHNYFSVPLRIRMDVEMEGFWLQGFIGAQIKVFEYDSRTTTDGGFHVVNKLFSHIDPDIGVGALYALNDSINARLTVGFLYLSLGLSFAF